MYSNYNNQLFLIRSVEYGKREFAKTARVFGRQHNYLKEQRHVYLTERRIRQSGVFPRTAKMHLTEKHMVV